MKRIVLTGGHGVGKSSLLLALEESGEHVVFEAAGHVRQLDRARGIAFPEDEPNFESRALARHLSREEAVAGRVGRVFFDRGAPDHLAYARVGHWHLGRAETAACRSRRYDLVVLVEPPPHGVANLTRVEAQFCERLVGELERVYAALGMVVRRLTWDNIDRRTEAVLNLASGTLDARLLSHEHAQ
jgi:predicted ATPase